MLLRSTISYTLSFSSLYKASSDLLFMTSVNAASCIISRGVNLSFLRSSCHFVCWSIPNIPSQLGFASEPNGARAYLGRFFLSPSPSPSLSLPPASPESSLRLFFGSLTAILNSSLVYKRALFLLSRASFSFSPSADPSLSSSWLSSSSLIDFESSNFNSLRLWRFFLGGSKLTFFLSLRSWRASYRSSSADSSCPLLRFESNFFLFFLFLLLSSESDISSSEFSMSLSGLSKSESNESLPADYDSAFES